VTCERVPLDWAATQNNLGNALGERENGTARLKEAVKAWDACLSVASSAWPSSQVEAIRTAERDTQAAIARRSGK
jgi:hypothetical protein